MKYLVGKIDKNTTRSTNIIKSKNNTVIYQKHDVSLEIKFVKSFLGIDVIEMFDSLEDAEFYFNKYVDNMEFL